MDSCSSVMMSAAYACGFFASGVLRAPQGLQSDSQLAADVSDVARQDCSTASATIGQQADNPQPSWLANCAGAIRCLGRLLAGPSRSAWAVCEIGATPLVVDVNSVVPAHARMRV